MKRDNVQIAFIEKGFPHYLRLSKGCKQKQGYLQPANPFLIKADRVIYGDEFQVTMRLSVGENTGHILITIADNTICITNQYGNEDGMSLYLQGPSIGQSVSLGKISQYITMDNPFELSVSYKNDIFACTIEGNEIYAQKPLVKPAGLIKLIEYAENFHIYDIIATGQFDPIEEFYSREFLLARAQKCVDRAALSVKDESNRPTYHLLPPANWNNDPNGLLFYNGYYHLFYQHNPYSDFWDCVHWGHARSRDLVYWEHLPIALWPSIENSENHCFSGSSYLMNDGKPVLFYTSIGHKDPQQWAALPVDDELLQWQKHSANPILTMDMHNGQYIEDWRDPYLFCEKGETYMVIGGHPGGERGSILLYKALNPELTEWCYLGILLSGEEYNWECPNFFKIDDKYVLIYSPHGQVKYYTGDLDLKNMKFIPETHGVIDSGAHGNFYAPNTLQKSDGRRILFGWIAGFKRGQGWQGAISLPRELSINENGRLIQKPVAELAKLRKKIQKKPNMTFEGNLIKIEAEQLQFELFLEIGAKGTENIGFRLRDENGKLYHIIINREVFIFGDEKNPVYPVLSERIKTVHIFFDRTVIEVFVNNGSACATKVIYPDKEDLIFEIFTTDKNMVIKNLDLWEMKSIW